MKKHLLALLAAVAVLAGCGSGNPSNSVRISGVLFTNEPGLDGNVQTGSKRLYGLSSIVAGNNYTVRTSIAPGGTLSGEIYQDVDGYLKSALTASLVSVPTHSYIYEVHFIAPASGNYVIALGGVPAANIGSQFFYGLRLLSSSATTSFTPALSPAVAAESTEYIQSQVCKVYSGATVSPPGPYTVTLTSKYTITSGVPHMFIYADRSLTVPSMLYSSLATSTDYLITTVSSGVTTTRLSQASSIPNVTFSATGPYILLQGNTATQYTLTVGN